MRQRHVLADREGLRHRNEAEQAMLEPRLLRGGRSAGQRAEARVDLERVGRDCDRIFAALAPDVGDRDRRRGLADGVRAEDS
jgi:hypothetical protein